MVITALTRNQVYQQWYRGFESHPLRQNRVVSLKKVAALFISLGMKEVKPMASRYSALTDWLLNCDQEIVRLSFSQLNSIITIPQYALNDRPSWANCKSSGSPFQKGWLKANYVVSAISLKECWVEFTMEQKAFKKQIDSNGVAVAIQKGYDCYNDMRGDPNHRYLSWEHCHKAFKQRKENSEYVDNDTLCLHLAWYLASWGMLRNSFLMQKDYRIHENVVELLLKPEWDELWDISAEQLVNKEKANMIIELSSRITNTYLVDGSEKKPTDTLITKILLGTVGCVPAYDQYFKKGVRNTGAASSQFTAKSLLELGALYLEYFEAFDGLREYCSKTGIAYPVAKVIDMCFFEYGLNL